MLCKKTNLTKAQRTAMRVRHTGGLAFWAGAVASVSANVYASEHTPLGIMIGIWIPGAALISLELLERVPVKGRVKYVRQALVGFLAVIAALASYFHLVEVFRDGGATGAFVWLMPLTVDVLMAYGRMVMRTPVPTSRPSSTRRKPQAKPDLKIAR